MLSAEDQIGINNLIGDFNQKEISAELYEKLQKQSEKSPFVVTDCFIALLKKKEKKEETTYWLIPISSYVNVISKHFDIDSMTIQIIIEVFNGRDLVQGDFPRSILTKSGIKDLVKYGLSYKEDMDDKLALYLMKCDSVAPIVNKHEKLGWFEQSKFKAYNLISSDNSQDSQYSGNLDIKPTGSLDIWLEMIQEEIIGNTPLEFVTMLGFSSPILAKLVEKYDLGTIMFNLSNSSSKGKTTAGMLATSVFSNPIIDKGTMRTFNATSNYLMSFLSNCNSYPVCLDEAGMSVATDMRKLIYLLCAGKDKGRMKTDGSLRESKEFNSIIVSTAEFDLIEETAPNGIRARLFELNDTFTTSAEHADKIKTIVTQNYAVAGETFMQYLITNKMDELVDDYEYCKQELVNQITVNHELSQRIMSKLAIPLQAVIYFNDCFDMNIDVNLFIEYILQLHDSIAIERTADQKALDYILQEVALNAHKYVTQRSIIINPIGKIEENGNEKEISILTTEVDKIFAKYNIANGKQLLKHWKKTDILKCEKDRLGMRVRLAKEIPLQTCYVFKIQDIKSANFNKTSEFNMLNFINSGVRFANDPDTIEF